MSSRDLRLFALQATHGFGAEVAHRLGIPLGEHEEREFEDGEHKARPLESVRGKDVFVLQSLYSDARQSVNDKLCRLLFFLGALRDAGAERLTAVVPYLCYARKDRRTKSRDPITTRYIAGLFEAVGIDRLVTLDVHNLAAFENAFRCRTENLEARPLFARHFASLLGGATPLTVVSPDVGGVKRAQQFRETLSRALGGQEVAAAFMEKQRSAGVVSGEAIVGDVDGRVAVVIDDLISTGTTLGRAARACRAHGAVEIHAAASHGLFVAGAEAMLAAPDPKAVVVTNTIPPFRLDPRLAAAKLVVLDTAPLFAAAIERLHSGGSLAELLAVESPIPV